MNPNTGQILTMREIEALPPQKAAAFTVELNGPPEAIHSVSAAVKAQRRRENKAARKARRKATR